MANTTETTTEVKAEITDEVAAFQAQMNDLLSAVSTNPAQVRFPQDIWGMTTVLRKAGLQAAASIRGNDAKQRIFLGTLAVLAGHAKARHEDDKAALESTMQRAKELSEWEANRDRKVAQNVPAPATEAAIPVDQSI